MGEGERPTDEEMGVAPKDLEVPTETEGTEGPEGSVPSGEAGASHEVGEKLRVVELKDVGRLIARAIPSKKGYIDQGHYLIEIQPSYRDNGDVDLWPENEDTDDDFVPEVLAEATKEGPDVDVRVAQTSLEANFRLEKPGWWNTCMLVEVTSIGVTAKLLSPELSYDEVMAEF